MTETSITGIFISAIVFIFIVLSGVLLINSGSNYYEISGNSSLDKFNDNNFKENLNDLELEMQKADSDSTASQSEQSGYLSQIGKLIAKSKAIQSIIKGSIDISKSITNGYIPNLLWWLAGLTLGILFIMLIISIYVGKKP